jgi:hypothetical protein
MKIEFKIKLYSIKIILYVSDNLITVADEIRKKHNVKLYKMSNKEIKKIDGCIIGQFMENENLLYVLVQSKNGKVCINTLTHEIYHLTSKIMKHNDFDFYHSDEPFARLNAFLNEKIIKNKKIKIKTI